jgi:hypothetical protein
LDTIFPDHCFGFSFMRPCFDFRRKLPVVGIAHFTATMRPWGLFDVPLAKLGHHLNRWYVPDRLKDKLDFIGINYYGQVSARDEEGITSGLQRDGNWKASTTVSFWSQYIPPVMIETFWRGLCSAGSLGPLHRPPQR